MKERRFTSTLLSAFARAAPQIGIPRQIDAHDYVQSLVMQTIEQNLSQAGAVVNIEVM